MAITHKPEEKYAYLLATDLSPRYLMDMENVFSTLRDYYNYPENNIRLVFLGTPSVNAADHPGLAGANLTELPADPTESLLRDTFEDNADGLFHKILSDPPCEDPDEKKVLLTYITGTGEVNRILQSSDGTDIDSMWLADRFSYWDNSSGALRILNEECVVHVFMQQAHAGSLSDCVTGFQDKSFTFCCAPGESSSGGSPGGSYFTEGWIKALQFNQLPSDASPGMDNLYADEAGGVSNLLINLEQAKIWAVEYCNYHYEGTGSSPNCDSAGVELYLGKPRFHIRDGDEPPLSGSWWESPDIYLMHPGPPQEGPDDYYYPDSANNEINIEGRVEGTHPVREFWIGAICFLSGGGGTGEHIINLVAPPVMKPDDPFSYAYVYDFSHHATHRCIRAKASLSQIFPDDLDDNNVDDIDWHVRDNDNEAQRNLDKITLPPPAPSPQPAPGDELPEPGDAGADQENPDEEAAVDQETAEAVSVVKLKGLKEHVYTVRNIFNTSKKFLIVFPDNYKYIHKHCSIDWYRLPDNPFDKPVKLDIVNRPVKHIPLVLEAGETAEILFLVALNEKPDIRKEILLPFEIVVDANKKLIDLIRPWTRRLRMPALEKEFLPFSGITVSLNKGKGVKLQGKVLDAKNKAVSGAFVFIRTLNERQSAIVKTNIRGQYSLTAINADSYRVYAEAPGWLTRDRSIFLDDGSDNELIFTEKGSIYASRIKVVMDSVKVKDRRDPLWRGIGDLSFFSAVIPDKDLSRTEYTRFPKDGFYRAERKSASENMKPGTTIFEGYISDNLTVIFSGSRTRILDQRDPYRRIKKVFKGNAREWYGKYNIHGDEWDICLRILRY